MSLRLDSAARKRGGWKPWIPAFAGMTVALWTALPVAAQEGEPRYVVEPCCELCPQAANKGAYNTKFLESFTTLIQGKDGWLFRTDDLRTTFGPDELGYRELKRLRNALKKRGTDLVIVYQPPRGMMHADKLPRSARKSYNVDQARFSFGVVLQKFREIGILAPDLSVLQREPGEPYFFRGDHHWTPYGAQRSARVVAAAIRELPGYQNLPKRKFNTERAGLMVKKGSFYKAASQICGGGYTDQYTDRFATTGDSSDLFADPDIPPVALVGTSNSAGDYNFAGFLQEQLGLDVYNVSVPGGGHSALLQYLPSPEFQKAPPSVLIWEMQTNHNLSARNFYRQVVPMVTDGCATKKPILSNRIDLRGARSEVLFNGGGRVLPLLGKDHVIDLVFDDKTVREVEATVWYTNGSKEAINLRYSGFLDHGGRFVFELRGDEGFGDRTFMSLDVRQPDSLKTGVGLTAKLCSRDEGTGQQQAAAPAPTASTRHSK